MGKSGYVQRRGQRLWDVMWHDTYVDLNENEISIYDEDHEGDRTLMAHGFLSEEYLIKRLSDTEWQILPPESAKQEQSEFSFVLASKDGREAEHWVERLQSACETPRAAPTAQIFE